MVSSRTKALVVAAAFPFADGLVVTPFNGNVAGLSQVRTAAPAMQFGFQNYERTEVEKKRRGENPINFFVPFASGSVDYPYGQKDLKKSINIAGIELPTFGVDPRLTVGATILGLLVPLPLFILTIIGSTPGTKGPFDFLDFVYPPAVEAKKAAMKKAGKVDPALAKAKAEAEAKVKKEEEAKKKKEAEATAKKAAEAKAKKEAEAKKPAKKLSKKEEDAAAAKKATEAKAKAEADKAAAEKAAKAAAEQQAKAAAEKEAARQAEIEAAAKAKAEVQAAAEKERYEASAEYRRDQYLAKNRLLREQNAAKQAAIEDAKALSAKAGK